MKTIYKKNKPLFNSIFFGLFYFLFSWGVDFSEEIKKIFMVIMFILPGITFPLSTSFYTTQNPAKNSVNKLLLGIISLLIYVLIMVLFTGNFTFLIGGLGSFLYLLSFVIIFKINRSFLLFVEILAFALLSSIGFILDCHTSSFNLGIALFCWTVINGYAVSRLDKIVIC